MNNLAIPISKKKYHLSDSHNQTEQVKALLNECYGIFIMVCE